MWTFKLVYWIKTLFIKQSNKTTRPYADFCHTSANTLQMQAPKGFVKPQKDTFVILIFITVAFLFAFHPASVAHVSFFSHKCTRQLRQMPNNRRRFLPRHENAAVASCTCGPRDQLNLLLAELENVRPPPFRPPLNCGFCKTRFVSASFFQRNQLWMKFPAACFDGLLKHRIFLSSKSQTFKLRHSDVPYYAP